MTKAASWPDWAGARLRKHLHLSARYSFVGVVCAVLNNLIIIAGSSFGINYGIMTVVALLVSTPIAYLLHAGFTFRQSGSWTAFLRFSASLMTSFAIFLILMFVLCTVLRAPVAIATPAATVLMFIWNYCAAHWAIARR